MSVDRVKLQEEIVGLLEPIKGKRQLAVFPDTSAEFESKYLKSKEGAYLVGYAGGRKIQGSGGSRNRQFAIDLTILSRGLNGNDGALAALAATENALDGKRFSVGGVPFIVETVSDSFDGEINRVWQYTLRLTLTTL